MRSVTGSTPSRPGPTSRSSFSPHAAPAAARRDASGALQRLGNVVLLERPLNAETLLSAAQSALRARARQYETRRHLALEEASRDAERLASAEAMRAKQALEVAVDAGELGTFHCPFPLRDIECSSRCREHLWIPAPTEWTSPVSIASSIRSTACRCAKRSVPPSTAPTPRRRMPCRLAGRRGALDPGEGAGLSRPVRPAAPLRRRHPRHQSPEAARERARGAARRRARGAPGGRARRPHEGRVPRDAVARAAHAAERDPRLDASAAASQRRQDRRAKAVGDDRAQRARPGAADRGAARRQPHHLGQLRARPAEGVARPVFEAVLQALRRRPRPRA